MAMRSTLINFVDDKKDKFNFTNPRFYSCTEELHDKKIPRGICINGADIVEQRFPNVGRLVKQWSSGNVDVLDDICLQASAVGAMIGALYTCSCIKPDTFFSAPEELRSSLYLVPGAREEYTMGLMKGMGISRNICVKGTKDPRNPLFSDVAAAHMADEMDRVTGDTPCSIMVQPRIFYL